MSGNAHFRLRPKLATMAQPARVCGQAEYWQRRGPPLSYPTAVRTAAQDGHPVPSLLPTLPSALPITCEDPTMDQVAIIQYIADTFAGVDVVTATEGIPAGDTF